MGNQSFQKFPMEILVTLFVIGSILFCSPVASAADQKWVLLGEIEGDLWFFDTDSITCKESFCKAWVKMQHRTSVKNLPAEKEEYTKSLHEYNCTWREYRILQTARYDANDNVIRSASPSEPGKKHVIPEAISREVYDMVCKQSDQQREQIITATREQIITATKEQERESEEAAKSAMRDSRTATPEQPVKQSPPQASVAPEKVVPPKTKEKDKKETKAIAPKPQKPQETTFTVQVGAFNNPSYANSFKTLLSKKGYKTYIITSKDKKLHKVCIGKFSNRKEAESLSAEFKNKEGLQAFVTTP